MNVTDTNAQTAALSNGARQASGGASTGAAANTFLEAFQRLPESRYRTSDSGLKVAVLKEGDGKAAAKGMKISVEYTGWLTNGTKFDSSSDRGRPFEFTLGGGNVIKGWEEGIAGMKPGERRQIVVPADLAYGDRRVNDIPPGSTLVFNVEAVAVGDTSANPKGTMSVVA